MRALVLVLVVGSCAPAYAEPVFVPSDDENVVGWIVLNNKHTLGLPGVSFVVAETPAGPVLLEWSQTPNDACPQAERPCPDTFEVVEAPSGFATVPHFLSVGEGDVGSILVVPILGF